jgi:hypothetical protein
MGYVHVLKRDCAACFAAFDNAFVGTKEELLVKVRVRFVTRIQF